MSDNRLPGSLKPQPDLPGVELEAGDSRGEWTGTTDSRVHADAINALWVEGYHVSFEPLSDGKMRVEVGEGTSAVIESALKERE